jgi:hypothetical protein
VRYRGKPHTVSLVASANRRGIELEIIQPVRKHSLYPDFLDKSGWDCITPLPVSGFQNSNNIGGY